MHVHVIKWVFFCWLSPSTIPSRFFKSFMKPFRNLKHLPNYWNKNAVWSTHRCNFVNWTCGCLSIMVFWISKIYIDTWIVVLFKWLQISLKTIYFKVDLTNLKAYQDKNRVEVEVKPNFLLKRLTRGCCLNFRRINHWIFNLTYWCEIWMTGGKNARLCFIHYVISTYYIFLICRYPAIFCHFFEMWEREEKRVTFWFLFCFGKPGEGTLFQNRTYKMFNKISFA